MTSRRPPPLPVTSLPPPLPPPVVVAHCPTPRPLLPPPPVKAPSLPVPSAPRTSGLSSGPAAVPTAPLPAAVAFPPCVPVRGNSSAVVARGPPRRPDVQKIGGERASGLARLLAQLDGDPVAFYASREVVAMVDEEGYSLSNVSMIYPLLLQFSKLTYY